MHIYICTCTYEHLSDLPTPPLARRDYLHAHCAYKKLFMDFKGRDNFLDEEEAHNFDDTACIRAGDHCVWRTDVIDDCFLRAANGHDKALTLSESGAFV